MQTPPDIPRGRAKVYLSGAISSDVLGLSLEDKKELFYLGVERVLCWPWVGAVVNPLEIEAECGGTCDPAGHIGQDGVPTHSHECFMKYDLLALRTCSHIALLPYWFESKGAREEAELATELGLGMIHLTMSELKKMKR